MVICCFVASLAGEGAGAAVAQPARNRRSARLRRIGRLLRCARRKASFHDTSLPPQAPVARRGNEPTCVSDLRSRMNARMNRKIRTRRVTANLPVHLLEEARKVTGTGITETLITGLERVRASSALAQALKLRGRLKLNLDLDELRGRSGD